MPENTNLILLASYAGSLFSFGRNAKSATVLAALQLAAYGAELKLVATCVSSGFAPKPTLLMGWGTGSVLCFRAFPEWCGCRGINVDSGRSPQRDGHYMRD